MKITSMSAQVKNPDRVSICVDGKYGFSLEISQVVELGIKIGNEIDELDLEKYKKASDYGKIYFKALVYSLSRPHSIRELELYLMKKNLENEVITSIVEKLISKNFIDDNRFALWWVENRMIKKGVSKRRLQQELMTKGVAAEIISNALDDVQRDEIEEIAKIIKRKINRYDDDKLKSYLMRQGFKYGDILLAISNYESAGSD